jgi:uncharacterized protein YjbJ (UPF0337 family)
VKRLPAFSRKERPPPSRVATAQSSPEKAKMDKEHVKGAADKAKGAVKDAAGKMTGDKGMQAEGTMDKAKGAMHNAAGDAKDAMKRASKGE